MIRVLAAHWNPIYPHIWAKSIFAGEDVTQVSNAGELLDEYRHGRYDVIIMDSQTADGLAVPKRVRQLSPRVLISVVGRDIQKKIDPAEARRYNVGLGELHDISKLDDFFYAKRVMPKMQEKPVVDETLEDRMKRIGLELVHGHKEDHAYA